MISIETLLSIGIIHTIALLSPGPDFVVITKNTLSYSRKIGLYTALGLGIGIVFHVSYSLTGLGLILSHNQTLYRVVQTLGGLYLLYLGAMAIKSTLQDKNNDLVLDIDSSTNETLSPIQAIKMGLFTNITNAKAGIYFLSILTQFINDSTSNPMKILIGTETIILTVAYFSLVAIGVSHPFIKNAFLSSKVFMERAFGVVLVGLGIKIIFI